MEACECPAMAKTFLEMFAEIPQVPRKTFWCLQKLRKRLEKLFGIRGNPASANFLTFIPDSVIRHSLLPCSPLPA